MYTRVIFGTLMILLCLAAGDGVAQQQSDTLVSTKTPDKGNTFDNKNPLATDTIGTSKFDPHKATIRSAILPGWGQAYNKKYWKIPIVYGALGVSAGIFFFNLKTYKELRQSVSYRLDNNPANDTLIPLDLAPLSTESLIFYRNAYRQNIDYSVLAFLVLWGLNVVDATVDAHLKGFDVSPNLTMKVKPQFKFETNTAALSLVFQFKQRNHGVKLPN